MFIVSVVLVVLETPVSQPPSSTVATAVSSVIFSTCSRRPTRKSPLSSRASLVRALASVAVVAVAVVVEVVAVEALLLAMSVVWVVVLVAAVASAAEAGAVLLRADMEVATVAPPLVATLLPLAVPTVAVAVAVVAALDTVEATATRLAQAATLGGRSTIPVHDTVYPGLSFMSLGCRGPALHDG
jgi:hypothetical protein